MTDNRVVLVTGVAGFWGARVAEQLLAEQGYHVIGIDSEPPKENIKGLDFIQTDIRNPLLVDLLKTENVHTVCHLKFLESARPSEASFDINVIGTIKALGACAEAGVQKVVLMSSMMVYGAQPENSAFLTESHPLNGSRAYGYTRDMVEIEAFCNGFRRQVPEMKMTTLRFSSIVGPRVDTPMTRFLSEPWTPILLGFDPMVQVIHEEDVIGALVHAVNQDVSGVFNVAAENVLPLSRLMGLAGKFPLPVFHLFVYWGTSLLGRSGLPVTRHVPIELDYIRYPWVGDLDRMRAELQFVPHYTAPEALREFAAKLRVRRYRSPSAELGYDEERLRDTIERRKRAQQRLANNPAEGVEEDENGGI